MASFRPVYSIMAQGWILLLLFGHLLGCSHVPRSTTESRLECESECGCGYEYESGSRSRCRSRSKVTCNCNTSQSRPESEHCHLFADANDECCRALAILHNERLPAEIREMILMQLDVVGYATYLQGELAWSPHSCLSEQKEIALVRRAHQRIQELRRSNDKESLASEALENAVRVIVRKMGVSMIEYRDASADKRASLVAQGMSKAIATIIQISDHPFWIRLGLQPFFEFGDFSKVYPLLPKDFTTKYDLHLLHASALAGDLQALEHLSSSRPSLEFALLKSLISAGCSGGHIAVVEWTLSRCTTVEKEEELVRHGLGRAIAHGRLEILKDLIERSRILPVDTRVSMAVAAIKRGKSSILKYLVDNYLGHEALQSPSVIRLGICESAVQGNLCMFRDFLDLGRKTLLVTGKVLERALTKAVDHGNLNIVEYLLSRRHWLTELNLEVPAVMDELFSLAVGRGWLHIVRFFLQESSKGGPVFPQFDPVRHGTKAIGLAAAYGHPRIIQYILMLKGTGKERYQGIDSSLKRELAFATAIAGRHGDVIALLHPYVDLKQNPCEIFRASCRGGNLKLIKSLEALGIFEGMALDVLGSGISTASYYGQLRIVEYVLENLVRVNTGAMAAGLKESLMWAIENGHADIVRYLLQRGDNGLYRFEGIRFGDYGAEALILAVNQCRPPILEFLLGVTPEGRLRFPELHGAEMMTRASASSFMHHYPTARLVITAMCGPCPYPVGSLDEKAWLLREVDVPTWLIPSNPHSWGRHPRHIDPKWHHLATCMVIKYYATVVAAHVVVISMPILWYGFMHLLISMLGVIFDK